VRKIRLRYPGACARCASPLTRGSVAWWDDAAKTATCEPCVGVAAEAPPGVESTAAPVPTDALPEPATPADAVTPELEPVAAGRAGASARQEYERRLRKRDARLEAKWGPLAGVAKKVAPVPQSVTAWHQGAVGEERLARYLTRELGGSADVLNDRRIPGTKANIDHVVVTRGGVWVIDAKNYRGRVETRDRGGFFTQDLHLYVGGRDQSKLVEAMARQVEVVDRALGEAAVPIVPCLCFVNSEWSLFAKPFRLQGVWITWSQAIPKLVGKSEAILDDADRNALAARIAKALPPAAR